MPKCLKLVLRLCTSNHIQLSPISLLQFVFYIGVIRLPLSLDLASDPSIPSSSYTHPGPPVSTYAFRAGVAVARAWGMPRSGMPLGITRRVSPPWMRCPGMGASWSGSSGTDHPSSGGANQTNVTPPLNLPSHSSAMVLLAERASFQNKNKKICSRHFSVSRRRAHFTFSRGRRRAAAARVSTISVLLAAISPSVNSELFYLEDCVLAVVVRLKPKWRVDERRAARSSQCSRWPGLLTILIDPLSSYLTCTPRGVFLCLAEKWALVRTSLYAARCAPSALCYGRCSALIRKLFIRVYLFSD